MTVDFTIELGKHLFSGVHWFSSTIKNKNFPFSEIKDKQTNEWVNGCTCILIGK